MPSKCVLILLDGLGDRAYSQLDNRTPLQAAVTPNLDRLAALGCNGLYHAASLGQALPSENAHFAMFGYTPEEFPGRGALEALGAGIPLAQGEVAFLAHLVELAVVDGALQLATDHPRAPGAEIDALVAALSAYPQGDPTIRFVPHRGGSGVLLLNGNQVSPFVTDTNIFTEGRALPEPQPWQEYASDPAAGKSALLLGDYLRWVYNQLDQHPVNQQRRRRGLYPVNGLVTQRGGRLKQVPDFAARNGLRGLSISSGVVYWGLAAFLGMAVRQVEDGKDPGLDLAHRLQLATMALADFDFIHVHTKAPDAAAHAKDPLGKIKVIEALDRGIGATLPSLLADPEVLLVVTSDHSTPSAGPLVHSGEPVPLTFVGGGVRVDGVERFDEVAVAGGALGTVRGGEFINLVINFLDRAKLAGLRDSPHDLAYWPGPCPPLRLTGSAKKEQQ